MATFAEWIDRRAQIYMVTHLHIHMLIQEATYWAGWWHRAVWPPALPLWDHLRRAGPRSCTTACYHGCHRHTPAQSVCWCCSEWGSRCPRSPPAGSTRSSRVGWNLPSASGYWQCYLRKRRRWAELVNDDIFQLAGWSYRKSFHRVFPVSFNAVTDSS